jgi:hypothetical protein
MRPHEGNPQAQTRGFLILGLRNRGTTSPRAQGGEGKLPDPGRKDRLGKPNTGRPERPQKQYSPGEIIGKLRDPETFEPLPVGPVPLNPQVVEAA